MGQLVVGLAGAGIGFALGGPAGAQIGWMLGQFAWNLLDPPKIYGPRLHDTKVQGADYGAMVPIVYGSVRIGGIGMGQGSTVNGPNEFTEHEESTGGKGGPEQISYRYTLSFFNEICEGPILGVRKRWGNGRLLTDSSTGSDENWPYTLYLGTTTQLPDPTMEIIYGTGNVCPMRGRAYESVEEVNCEDFGNARPNMEYEVYTSGGDIPWRVSTFDPWPEGAQGNIGATMADGVITTGYYTSVAAHYYEHQFDINGNEIGPGTDTPIAFASTGEGFRQTVVGNLAGVACFNSHNHGTFYGWFEDAETSTEIIDDVPKAALSIYQNDYIYSVVLNGSDFYIVRYDAPGGVLDSGSGLPSDTSYAITGIGALSTLKLGTSNDGSVWAAHPSSGQLWKFDEDLEEIHYWNTWDPLLQAMPYNFHVYNDMIVFDNGQPTRMTRVVRVEADWTFTLVGQIAAQAGPVITLGGPLVLVNDGVLSLDPPPAPVILGDIVADLLERAGLTGGQYDVTDLTQEVRGFVVASQMTVRNAIDILRKAFFFDVTEYDGQLVCVNRGHDAIDTIPDEDLAAHEPGTQPPDPLEVTRAPEAELPRTVYITYYEAESDYQSGSQYWRRTVTSSQSDVTLDLPVVFTATEALMRAQWHMHFAWLERERYTWYTTRKWAKLVPTDVVVVRGVNIRITTRTESPNGLIKFEGVRAFAGPYSAPITEPIGGEVPGAPGSGQPPQTPPGGATAATGMILIDGPWISESDSTTAIRAALYRSGTGAWPGATVYKSVDGGTSYTAAGSTTAGAVVGTVASALGDFAGGNVADEANVITVVLQSGTLDSTTADGLINGLNLIALGTPDTGWEFLQYRTATLVDTDTYELSGLLRGRFGTEWMMPEHATGESLVLVSSTILIAGSAAEIGLSRKYKPVTLGAALASATAQDFTNSAVALKPYAPVLLGGGRDASGNLTLNWTSRRRGSGGWPNGVDLAATDPTNWQVDIYDDGTYTTNVRSYGITDETVDYSAADQTTDFGSPQATVYWTVAQIGSTGLGYTTQAAT